MSPGRPHGREAADIPDIGTEPRAAGRRRLVLGAVAAGLAGCVLDPDPDDGTDAALPAGDTQAIPAPGLERGVNLSWWMNLSRRLAPSDAELATLHRVGFTHVRLPVDPSLLGWSPTSDATLPPLLAPLDAAVARILASGLALVLDVHPGDQLVSQLREGDADRALARLWTGLAARYGTYPVDRVVFEIANEPHRFVHGRYQLARLNVTALAAIRQVRPSHRVLVNGLFDRTLSLRTITPLSDPDVIYGFQLYDPFVVTHQGADWDPSDPLGLAAIRGVPYPASRAADWSDAVAWSWLRPNAVRAVSDYRRQNWNAARIDATVQRAAAWSVRHRAPLLCTEFGVMRTYIDPASRLAWLHDARVALEHHGIPWTVWEYAGLFGITARCTDEPRGGACGPLQDGALRALGLVPPTTRQTPGE
jgi:endoglucanase